MDIIVSHTIPMRGVTPFDNSKIKYVKFAQNSLYIF